MDERLGLAKYWAELLSKHKLIHSLFFFCRKNFNSCTNIKFPENLSHQFLALLCGRSQLSLQFLYLSATLFLVSLQLLLPKVANRISMKIPHIIYENCELIKRAITIRGSLYMYQTAVRRKQGVHISKSKEIAVIKSV